MSANSVLESIPIGSIVVDETVRSRIGYDDVYLKKLKKVFKEKKTVEPVVLFFDGKQHILADGFYRLKAMQSVNSSLKDIQAYVKQGSFSDAVSYSCLANNNKVNSKVLKRSNKCKYKAVSNWLNYVDADRKIASNKLGSLLGISSPTVTKIRQKYVESERKKASKSIKVEKKERRSKKRSLVPVEVRVAVGALKREIELKYNRHWNQSVKESILESVLSVVDWVEKDL